MKDKKKFKIKSNNKKSTIPWVYSDIVQDHFFNPRNFLKRSEKFRHNAVGEAGNPICGD